MKIAVADESGAPIPEAQIHIMSTTEGKLLAFTADRQGIAEIDLNSGEYQYRVAYPAFCARNGTITIDRASPREITTRLEVAECPGCLDCVTPLGVEPSGHSVAIKVMDATGAVIPNALVEVDPASSESHSLKTDGNGRVVIGLPSGLHMLTVRARGFAIWRGFAEVQRTKEAIAAKLSIGVMDYPFSVVSRDLASMHIYRPEIEPIALEVLEELPLPASPLVRHKRSR